MPPIRVGVRRYPAAMPIRATKRGDERTPLDGSHDVLICGASFAGLAVARELAGSGADVLIVDRYEIGERQTSACGIPTEWLRALGLMDAERQRFDSLLMHTPHGDARYRLPWTFSTFDYRELCELLWRDCDARFETAKVNGRARRGNGDGAIAVETDRGVDLRPARRRRARLAPHARLRRRLPAARRAALARPRGPPRRRAARTSRSGSTAATSPPATAGRFPARDELRIGVGSFDPRFHVRDTTELLAEDLGTRAGPLPGQLDPPQAAPRRPRAASSSPATRPATACR